jgi:Tol biopolymer transport system component
MSDLDDRIREGLQRLARPAEGEGPFDRVVRRKRRYRVARRLQAAGLSLAVIAASAGGVWGLTSLLDLRDDPRPAGPAVRNGLIAFVVASGGQRAIKLVDPAGGPIRELATELHVGLAGDYPDTLPAWSPDGSQIAYAEGRSVLVGRFNGPREVDGDHPYVFGGDDPPDGRAVDLDWSPNGSRVAVSKDERLFLWSGQTLSPFKEVPLGGAAVSGMIDWGSSGAGIAFAGDRDGQRGIFTVDPTTGAVGVAAAIRGWPTDPSWSPDGSAIVFSNQAIGLIGIGTECAVAGATPGPDARFGLYTVDRASGDMLRLTRSGCHDDPVWSPDGSQIAFVDGGSDLDVMDRVATLSVVSRDGSARRDLASGVTGGFAWAPDGSSIAYATHADGRSMLRLVPVEGGRPRTIASVEGRIGQIAWQPLPATSDQPVPGPTMSPSPVPLPGGPPGRATMTADHGSRVGLKESHCWTRPTADGGAVGTCVDTITSGWGRPLLLSVNELVRFDIDAGAPPSRLVLDVEWTRHSGSFTLVPSLRSFWRVEGSGPPPDEGRARLCGTWRGQGTVCWRFALESPGP